jgi:hypothetical protein
MMRRKEQKMKAENKAWKDLESTSSSPLFCCCLGLTVLPSSSNLRSIATIPVMQLTNVIPLFAVVCLLQQ